MSDDHDPSSRHRCRDAAQAALGIESVAAADVLSSDAAACLRVVVDGDQIDPSLLALFVAFDLRVDLDGSGTRVSVDDTETVGVTSEILAVRGGR